MEMKDEKKAKQIAEERMAIIAPLLNPGLDAAEIRKIRQQNLGGWRPVGKDSRPLPETLSAKGLQWAHA